MHDWYCEYARGLLDWDKRSVFVGADGQKLSACKCAYRRMKVRESREMRGLARADWMMKVMDPEKAAQVALEQLKMQLWLTVRGHTVIELNFQDRLRISRKYSLSRWMQRVNPVPERLSEWA